MARAGLTAPPPTVRSKAAPSTARVCQPYQRSSSTSGAGGAGCEGGAGLALAGDGGGVAAAPSGEGDGVGSALAEEATRTRAKTWLAATAERRAMRMMAMGRARPVPPGGCRADPRALPGARPDERAARCTVCGGRSTSDLPAASRRSTDPTLAMRIATWNVNSLKARLEKVAWWIERANPDVLLLQETKCPDADAPRDAFAKLGYELVHHGTGGRNGVAIASRTPVSDVETNLGMPLEKPADEPSDEHPFAEPRAISGVVSGVRLVSLYAPNGRVVGSPFYAAKLAWFDRLARWLEGRDKDEMLLLGGDFNVAPT